MKSLSELANDVLATHRTDLPNYQVLDKNLGTSGHCYIDHVYESLFASYRFSAQKILEIGVNNGGSMLLWQKYFTSAEIQGIDINPSTFFWGRYDRIKLFINNAYNQDMLDRLDDSYDIIIDDGPHTLESMRYVVKNYLPKVAPNGLLIIEDISDSAWIKTLIDDLALNGYRTSIQAFDLRNVNLRYDDMILVVKRIG